MTSASAPGQDICVLFSTIDAARADDFARRACEARLVSCVNAVPGARSTYWWDGRICQESEVLLWMEAPAHDVAARIAALSELHPYETPKVLALDVREAHEAYQAWCIAQTCPPGAPQGPA